MPSTCWLKTFHFNVSSTLLHLTMPHLTIPIKLQSQYRRTSQIIFCLSSYKSSFPMLSAAPRGLLSSPSTLSRRSSQLTVVQDLFFFSHYPLAATDVSLLATYLASPVHWTSNVIMAILSSATLLKSTYFPPMPSPSKIFILLYPLHLSQPPLMPHFSQNLFNTGRVNDET